MREGNGGPLPTTTVVDAMATRWYLDGLDPANDADESTTGLTYRANVDAASPDSPRDIAADCFSDLRAELAEGRSAVVALERQHERLRRTSAQMRQAFEQRLLDALAAGDLPQRLELFKVALALYAWSDTDRLLLLGTSGQWALRVRSEEAAVLTARQHLPPQARALLGLLEADGNETLPELASRYWPRLHQLILAHPAYFSLCVDATKIHAWEQVYQASAQRRPAWSDGPMSVLWADRSRHSAWVDRHRDAWLPAGSALAILACMLVALILPREGTVSAKMRMPQPSPGLVLVLPEQTSISSETCAYIDLLIHQPTWQIPGSAEQRHRFGDTIRHCLEHSFWSAHAHPDRILDALGIVERGRS